MSLVASTSKGCFGTIEVAPQPLRMPGVAHGGHRKYTDLNCCRIINRTFPVGITMVGLWVPSPVTVRASFGRGRVLPWPGDGLLGLRPQQSSYRNGHCHAETRMLRQEG
ncbi:hypothetical protein AVEN_87819-1 [Araneus ventricosus]|uniref:Uncharacterized protein n=1 Tax=Araneus ventricosus TaxID=182803 RepID=A0A4Y2BBS4_ARAVE|nr:hypothetical protein AVEN_87819-1 [Araneus ventricosus]